MNASKFITKIIIGLALIFCLQGCQGSSSTTDTYFGVACVCIALLYFAFGGNRQKEPPKGCAVFGFVAIIVFIVSIILGIISYRKDRKYTQLFMENSAISYCLHPNGEFTKVNNVNVVQPFIILKEIITKNDNGSNKEELVLIDYSEEKPINENSLKNLKTVVIVNDVLGASYDYGRYGRKSATITVYNANIKYFNLINKQYAESEIKKEFTAPETTAQGGLYNVDEGTIIKEVKSKIK